MTAMVRIAMPQCLLALCEAAWKREKPIMVTAGVMVRGVIQRSSSPISPVNPSSTL